jgi:Leucine-rich repeat (LRR) protein
VNVHREGKPCSDSVTRACSQRPSCLDLSGCGLSTIPAEIGALVSLEVLNLGGNPLSDGSLPASFTQLVNLRVLFFLGCDFTSVPEMLGAMPSLYMLSFKANKINTVPAASLSPKLGWLILSDNEIETLPDSIGACVAGAYTRSHFRST